MNDSEPKTERECRRVLNSINHAEQAPPPTEPYPYTEQQIDEHCKDLERCIRLTNAKPETSYLPISLQIIRQLQEDIKSRDKLDKQNFEALKACSLSARA